MNRSDEVYCFAQVADNDSCGFPLSRLRSINGGTGELILAIDEPSGNVDAITLTTGADEMEACKELVRKFNEGPHSDGALIIADDIAGTYCSSTITGVAIA